jgi:hypothetical protein
MFLFAPSYLLPWTIDKTPSFSKGARRAKRECLSITDVGQIRTDAPKGTRFQVLRDNHSATTSSMCYWTLRHGTTIYTWRYKSLNDSVCGVKALWKVESGNVVQDGYVQYWLEGTWVTLHVQRKG